MGKWELVRVRSFQVAGIIIHSMLRSVRYLYWLRREHEAISSLALQMMICCRSASTVRVYLEMFKPDSEYTNSGN